ncbi:DUF1963 domain-containing protein [Aeoliella sp. ICT_H6.2]|uniref:DUF1963 domain-containing protein n=1 Tax=Aeoliella straminimaris TaxID=2954799 RepID=A0A9X2FG29_9BACT|nr:DUF1963 domain-containing protein [Aeoliella straminimaris]MCO6045724.1 DUF1963 domain-containing protein [Aeoliella straminimaris]
MPEKVVCTNPGCSNMILPSTAERTGGPCMPCYQKAKAAEREAFIRDNRKDVNVFDGVNDPVEIIKLIHSDRPRDPLINYIPYPTPADQVYLSLSDAEQVRLAEYAETLLGTDRQDEGEAICGSLASFTHANLERCLRKLVERKNFWPSFVFRTASAELRDELFAHVETDDENRLVILMALAWIGDSEVMREFTFWRDNPPGWLIPGSWKLEDIPKFAGWELTHSGDRRDLYFSTCLALRAGPSTDLQEFRAVAPRDDKCPWGSHTLTNLLELNLGHISELRSLAVGHIQVCTCEECTAFATVYGDYNESGLARWSESNRKPDSYTPDESDSWSRMPTNSLQIAAERSVFHAADWTLPTTYSQLGGHPTWVQHAEYPTCPNCSQTMMFLAQIDHAEIEDLSEGTYYTFICTTCPMTATNYQQT